MTEPAIPDTVIDVGKQRTRFDGTLPTPANDRTKIETMEACTARLLDQCFPEKLAGLRSAANDLKISDERFLELIGVHAVDGERLLAELQKESREPYESLTPERRKRLLELLVEDDITTKHADNPETYATALQTLGFSTLYAKQIAQIYTLVHQIQNYGLSVTTLPLSAASDVNPTVGSLEERSAIRSAILAIAGTTNGGPTFGSNVVENYLKDFERALTKLLSHMHPAVST